ncbi:hypothetical protein Val02_14170 [Virgisporangium aliadipatigenens]|uniref:Methyltransferase type 12 domain-containing protein n=1 Tax=Virgisporangium aliadipatigenens TaxID=741659 RepID=A0A8J4DP49_9ACTN|nr:class I SAM-dependent methyltransferase [Virgisporangium aliadipatigenens]GIJ44531.1 hypothetical protein Val02_14170 [Virgisporangium aliadipatigenens]
MTHDHLSELLDLDAEVLHAHITELTGWIRSRAGTVEDVLDLGAGTGTGTFALLREFPRSKVTAVDADPEMLERLAAKARSLDLAERVRTVPADLDTGWPDLSPVDVAWASASMHHMADPDATLARVHATLRPGGIFAVVELNSFPRFLPTSVGDGLEDRVNAVVDAERARRHVHIDTDWPAHFVKAGFAVEEERTFALSIEPPVPAVARRYAEVTLQRIRHGIGELLDPRDAAALDALLDPGRPESVQRRDDLSVRTTRHAWLLRRA